MTVSEHEHFMGLAIEQAELAMKHGDVPVGAVLVRNGEVIAAACNRREQDHDPLAHAEILALRRAAMVLQRWELTDCTMYVTLEPCPMCASALVMARLPMCVFAARDPQKGCFGSVYDFAHDPAFQSVTSWKSGIMEKACRDQLQAFFRKRRNRTEDGQASGVPIRTDVPDA